jgi:hypothetical protein
MTGFSARGFTPFLRFRNSWFWLGRRPELVAGRGREADQLGPLTVFLNDKVGLKWIWDMNICMLERAKTPKIMT